MGENPSSSGADAARKLIAEVWARPEYVEPNYDDYDCSDPNYEDCAPSDCANWILMYETGPFSRFGEPCHGNLDTFEEALGLIEFDNFEMPPEPWTRFVDWMMTGEDFPWATGRPLFYENKAWYWTEEQLKTQPSNAIGAFLVLSRMGHEKPNSVKLWNTLVDAGCGRRASILYALLCSRVSDEYPVSNLDNLGHSPFNMRHWVTAEQYKNFMTGTPVGPRFDGRPIPQSDYFGPCVEGPWDIPILDCPFPAIFKDYLKMGKYSEELHIIPDQLVTLVKEQEKLFK